MPSPLEIVSFPSSLQHPNTRQLYHFLYREVWDAVPDPQQYDKVFANPGFYGIRDPALKNRIVAGAFVIHRQGEYRSLLALMGVDYNHRGQGLGKRLLQHVEAESRANNRSTRLELVVESPRLGERPARDFYVKHHYRQSPKGVGWMYKDL